MVNYLVSVEELSIVIINLKIGEATEIDSVMAEHIIHRHPAVIVYWLN